MYEVSKKTVAWFSFECLYVTLVVRKFPAEGDTKIPRALPGIFICAVNISCTLQSLHQQLLTILCKFLFVVKLLQIEKL